MKYGNLSPPAAVAAKSNGSADRSNSHALSADNPANTFAVRGENIGS